MIYNPKTGHVSRDDKAVIGRIDQHDGLWRYTAFSFEPKVLTAKTFASLLRKIKNAVA